MAGSLDTYLFWIIRYVVSSPQPTQFGHITLLWIFKSNDSKESWCEVEYDAYDTIHMWRISIVILQKHLKKKMAIKWWQMKKNHKNVCVFYVYQVVSTCQTVFFYPRNCSFWTHVALFEKTASKDIRNNILSQHVHFSFSLDHFQHTCWILWLYAQNYDFWGDMNRELLLLLTFPYTCNANPRHSIIYRSIFLSNT